jgi:transcriptional regulator with GAF, ATPase, and Fis domain
MSLQNLTEQLASAARELGSEDVEHTLQKGVALAVELIDGCDGAGVTMGRRGKSLETPVSTADWVARGDALQNELQEGPCLDAVWEHDLVTAPDLAKEERWTTWGPRVVEELGVRSMMCIKLFAHEETVGALNLYSTKVGAFEDPEDHTEGMALAAHVAVAFVAAQEIEHLTKAMISRTMIGQAEGILMERFDIPADRAFEVLKRASSHYNTKLFQVASELVRTRRLPARQGIDKTGAPAEGDRAH